MKKDKRPGIVSRLRRFYEERPLTFAFVLMGVSIVAIVLGAYMRASATAG